MFFKIALLLVVSTPALSCAAQDKTTIKQTTGFDGEPLPYITESEFKNIKINNQLSFEAIMKPNSIENVISELGDPNNLKTDQDKAIDGTVLFETKILRYQGLTFYYPQNDNIYQISRIDLKSANHFLSVNGEKIEVGMSVNQISSIVLPTTDNTKKKSTATVYVLQTDHNDNLKRDKTGNLAGGYRYINFTFDSNTKIVAEISIVFIVP